MKSGIDVSKYQGDIDWPNVKVDFAIIRAGWSWYEGGMDVDTKFRQNASGATKAGIPWGVYLYAYDRTPEAAVKSANILADLLEDYNLDYPVAYDFEDNQYLKFNRYTSTEICNAFLKTIQERGYYAMIYTYTNFAKNYLNMDGLSAYDVWIADYTGKVGWQGIYGMWQYSSKGRVNGVPTDVDLNEAYRDYPKLIREMKKSQGTSSSKPQEPVDNTKQVVSEINELSDMLKTAYEKSEKIKTYLS